MDDNTVVGGLMASGVLDRCPPHKLQLSTLNKACFTDTVHIITQLQGLPFAVRASSSYEV